MSEIGDQLQGVFSRLARESLVSRSQTDSSESDPVASGLSNAGQAYQLNSVTESSSGFSLFQGVGGGMGGLLGRGADVLGDLFGGGSGDTNSGPLPSVGEGSAPSGGGGSGGAGCQLDTQTQADLERFTLRLADSYRDGLVDVQTNAPVSTSARRTAVTSLWSWVRDNVPGPRLMPSIAHSSLSDAEKQRHLGWFSVQILRMEFLLGWLQMGGLNQSSLPTWERSAPDNLDEFYTSNAVMGGGDGDWCSRFAGYGRKRTGFRQDLISGLIYNSGYRLYEWAVHDRPHNYNDPGRSSWPEALGLSEATNAGVQVIERSDFSTLSSTLSSSSNRGTDVDAFFSGQGMTPQCGDILIQGRSGNRWKNAQFNSHTVTVEEYDAASRVIYTLEGNAGGSRCVGGKLDLTDTADAGILLYLIRPGHQQHMVGSAPACTLTASQVADLRSGVANYVSELATVATNLNYLKSSSNTAKTYTWYTGNAT